jgi:hypothetical protein
MEADQRSWFEGMADVMSVVLLDERRRVLSMSPASLRFFNVTEEDAVGRTLLELSSRDQMLAVLPVQWRRPMVLRGDPFGELLVETALQFGNASAWIWLMTPAGQMFRAILNVVKLERGFLVYLGNVEDPYSRSVVRAEQDGSIIGALGARFTLESLQIFEDYISGATFAQIATDHRLPVSRVRAMLDEIAEQAGFTSSGALRTWMFNLYAEEMLPARHSILPVVSDELPGFPRRDRTFL